MIMWYFSHYKVCLEIEGILYSITVRSAISRLHLYASQKNKPNEGSLSVKFTMVYLQNRSELLLPYQARAI